ncbi:Methyltransferase domain-containing protein [Desulfonatronum thiosulfatophilum]|uniref:Methyltransferase domain-containing protein n=1 Tax=Desulfonatronum thiosulfatophilum TaxID=617002 RepID=A0A1G6AVI4_9BACT|nr:class I SAM-dependent methyltransferase [Desulfonatronum thiosulfatophilum]SDB12385.1 Methyltransferase domain-containing protein [Desulfonatronum thiosulfatophilum]
MSEKPRLYADLAWLWPMWGDHRDEYARYSAHITRLIRQYARRPVASLLDISCGGGKNVFNLKHAFQVTGLDLSPVMLNLASSLNPECEFIIGDMRTFSLDRKFDAVVMDDGISYMLNRTDLAEAMGNAFSHLEPGGVLIATPDVTTETFRQNLTTCTPGVREYQPEGVDVVFVQNVYDPDPRDEQYESTMIYLIREHGRLRVETDRHVLGIFSRNVWMQVLIDVGFEVHCEAFTDGENEYIMFACVKKSDATC